MLGTFLDPRSINAHDKNDNATPLNTGDDVQETAIAAHNLDNGVGNIEAPSDLDGDRPPLFHSMGIEYSKAENH